MTIRCASTLLLAFCLACGVVPAAADEDDAPARDPRTPDEKAADLVAAMKSSSPEDRTKAALAAVDLQHPKLVSPLLRLLSDAELGVRESAMRALATRRDRKEKRRAASALNPRIARFSRKTSDQYELLLVIESLQALGQESSIKPLLDGIQWNDEPEVAHARITAVGYIPHPEAVERLIQFLDRGRKGDNFRGVARRALMFLTGTKHNRNPDQWRAWWRENKKTIDLVAIANAREAAEAERKAKAEEKKRKQEEARRRKEERRKKKKKKPQPGSGGEGD
jgi:hypothetical protein